MDKRLYVLVLFGIFMMTVFGVTGCKKIYQTTEIVKELKEYKIDSEEDMTEVVIVMVNDGGEWERCTETLEISIRKNSHIRTSDL